MASNHDVMEHLSSPPDPRMRAIKSQMEEELLIKLGAKREVIEIHPLILSTRLERTKSSATLRYSRTIPPAIEATNQNQSPWCVADQALRQMSNFSRRGPRDFLLPNLVKPVCPAKTLVIPAIDEEYFARREAAQLRLCQLLGEWTEYESQAYNRPASHKRTATKSSDLRRRSTNAALEHVIQAPVRPSSSDSFASSGSRGSTNRAVRPVPRSRKTRNKWQEMAGEALLHIKACHMRLPAELPRSELRIYVSSTPDLLEEREFLEEVAYPKLREFSEKLGLNCHVVDMRNGAGVLDNSLHTFDLIEKEMRKCRELSIGPYFVSLLGHKSREAGLPGFFPKSVYELLRETLVRENIPGVDAFDEVYRLDSNRAPPVYIKQPIRAWEEYQTPEQIEKTLLQALKEAVRIIQKSSDASSDVDFYRWSALVKEHDEGILSSYSPLTDSLCFMMDAQEAEIDPGRQAKPIRRLRHAVFRHFRRFSGNTNLVNFKSGRKTLAYLRSVSDTFIAGVASLLKAQIRNRDYNLTQQLTEGSEALQHVRLALAAARDGIDNTDAVNQVRKVLDTGGTDAQAIVLLGPSGMGKTTIACQVARASVLWEPRRRVVNRCLGSTLRSSSLYRVLESMINQLGVIYNCHVDLPEDTLLPDIVSVFCDVLQRVGESHLLAGGLLVILDQLDCLPDLEARFLTSILDSLPPGVMLLLTCNSQSSFVNVLKNHWSVKIIYRTFMNKTEVGRYMKESLSSVKRVLTDDQFKTALGALPEEPAPVYPQILYHITRWWPSATLPDIEPFSGAPEEDFASFISFVESDLGKAFSRYALSLLAAARHGLADQELLHLLSKDADLSNEIEQEEQERVSFVEGFPYQLQLSSLIERLGIFLPNIKIEGESVYHLTSQSLRAAISQRYMNDGFFYIIHQRLANFFQFIRRGLLLSSKDISENRHRQLSKYHWRTLRCVPYHLCHISADTSEVWQQLKQKVFFNFTWLVNAVYSGFLTDLLADMAYALDTVSLDPDIQYLQHLLLQARQTITHNPLSMAAVFSSQNPEDKERAVRDNVRALIHEARQWLTQVHLQALVPVTYTCDKIPRLLVKENSLFGMTRIHSILDMDSTRGRLLLQRGTTLSVLDILTREEISLVSLETGILGMKVVDSQYLMIMANGVSSGFSVELLDFNKGKHLKSVPIKENELLWYDMRSPKAVFFATGKGIKCLDVEQTNVINVLSSVKQPWQYSHISLNKADKVITVTKFEEKQEIRQMRIKDAASVKTTRVKEEPANPHCDPLVTTKDGRFIVHVTERLAHVIEARQFLVTSTLSHHNVPIVRTAMSRSHEHMFMAYANGSVTGHTLLSGQEVLSAKIRASPKPASFSGSSKASVESAGERAETELITAMVTSEDDHFLLLGSSIGQIYIFHLPTGQQLVDITTGQASLTSLIFLTDRSHFQHLVSLDTAGKALHWNLRPLLAECRRLVQPFICDADMAREEEPKVDLSLYYPVYQAHLDDRVFLNGPDVAAFYQPIPETLFAELSDLDPAFGEQFDWEVKGSLADLNDHLLALVCGHELADVMLTISSDFRLSRWSLKDGSLTWSRHLPGKDDRDRLPVIHDLALVYWDQAVFLVQNSRIGTGHYVSVIYTGEGQRKVLSRDQIHSYWLSTDRTQVILQGSQSGEAILYKWDLIEAKEEQCELLNSPLEHVKVFEPAFSNVTAFSPSLCRRASLSLMTAQSSLHSKTERQHQRGDDDVPLIVVEERDHHVKYELHSTVERDSQHDKSGGEQTHEQNEPHKQQNSIPKVSDRGTTTKLSWTKIRTKLSTVESGLLSTNQKSSTASRLSASSGRDSYKKASQLSRAATPVQASETSGNRKTVLPAIEQTVIKGQEENVQDSSELATEAVETEHGEAIFPVGVAAACFIGEDILCVGARTGHVLCLPLPHLEPMCVLGETGPRIIDTVSYNLLLEMKAPHAGPVHHVAPSDDVSTLVTADRHSVCLWDVARRELVLKCCLDKGHKISRLVISKEASIIAIASTERVLRLWTPVEQREVASYMTNFDIVDLQMTSDCHKVIVRGVGKEGKPVLEVFEVRNVDDILMKVPERRVSREQERRESLVQERVRKRSETRRKSLDRRASVDV